MVSTLKAVTCFFPAVVRTGFPIEGVHFIMGNDVAGSNGFPVPEVVCPILRYECDCHAKYHPGALITKVLTRAPSPQQTHTVPDSLFSAPAEGRLPPAGGAVGCQLHQATHLPVKELYMVVRRTNVVGSYGRGGYGPSALGVFVLCFLSPIQVTPSSSPLLPVRGWITYLRLLAT